MKTGEERGELVTLLDEPYLAVLFNYLPSPPSAPAVGAMFVVVTVAYIAAVVELSIAKKKWNDQNVYLSSVLPNDSLVVERFLETMELWHV
jgi:hypothetical protein